MNTLPTDWLTQGWIDAEYKKYIVLAYLQAVRQHFDDQKLHPALPDLRHHYHYSLQFQQSKGSLHAAFPKRVSHISGPPPTIEYKSELTDHPHLVEVDAVMAFALPRFGQMLTEGQRLWADIAATLTLEPIGLLPLRPEEGYLLLHRTTHTDTAVYQFAITLYDDHEPGGRRVQLRFVERIPKRIGTTYEHIKLDLVRRNQHLPNPATFMLETQRTYPEEETLLPIARQLLATQDTA